MVLTPTFNERAIMSVAKKIITAIALFASTVTAQGYTADSDEYRHAMSEYGKAIFAARYTEKWCGKVHGIHFNEVYFRAGPPNLWNKEVYDKFMAASMAYTRSLMDKHIVELGEDQFCTTMVNFYKSNFRDAVKPVLFDK